MMGYVYIDFSANTQGMLVYPPQTSSVTELHWRDRTGRQLGSLGVRGEYYTPRISPDGKRGAFTTRRDGNNSDIWLANLSGGSFTRFTFDPAIDENPVWADSATVLFANDASGNTNLYRKAATGAGTVDRLTTDTVDDQPLDWSGDGRFVLYTRLTQSTEIMIIPADGGQAVSFLGNARGLPSHSSIGAFRAGSHTISTTLAGAKFMFRHSSPASPPPRTLADFRFRRDDASVAA